MKCSNRRTPRYLGAVALVLALGGCASLPLPGTPDEALVVIPTDVTVETWQEPHGVKRVAGGQLYFTASETGREYRVSFAPGKPYVALAVPPGQYYLTNTVLDMEFNNENGRKDTWQDQHKLSTTFYAGANSVQILGRMLYVTHRSEGYGIGISATVSAEIRQTIRADLTADRRWPAWEEYQLLNFD